VRHALLESGPTLLREFCAAGLVDRLDYLLAGVWLGAGPRGLSPGARLDAPVEVVDTRTLGQDVLIRYAV
jgi:riboflavin biosynthesis pyrimidine reductase